LTWLSILFSLSSPAYILLKVLKNFLALAMFLFENPNLLSSPQPPPLPSLFVTTQRKGWVRSSFKSFLFLFKESLT